MLKVEHGPISLTGKPASTTPQATRAKDKNSTKKHKLNFAHRPSSTNTDGDGKGNKYCPIHGWCSHTADECILLKNAIQDGKQKYSSKRQKLSRTKTGQSFSKQEVSVMILSACNQTVNRALKIATSKGNSVHFHQTEDDASVETDELQEQVNQLQLYRDPEVPGEESDSGLSSSKSD